VSGLLAALPEADLAAIRAAAISTAQAFLASDGSVVLPAAVLGAKARKAA
jgi:hypothetical protein